MHKLRFKTDGSYVSKNGNDVFRYILSGSPEAIEAFKEMQGSFYRENDNGQPLWFTTRFAGNTGDLIVNEDTGKMYPDMTAFKAAASLAEQHGGNVGQAIAQTAASQLLGLDAPSAPSAPATEESNSEALEEEESEEGEEPGLSQH